MFKYVMTFSKTGTICYTSHLDLMRMFTRAFKRGGIKLAYSQGFNPHPKLGFAQPLSLGYEGMKELMEFETVEEHDPSHLREKMSTLMPPGLDIINCSRVVDEKKTLAARTYAAEYIIMIPSGRMPDMTGEEMKQSYMSQEKIITLKKQKKKKEPVEIDIKPMIRDLTFTKGKRLVIKAVLDSGSNSNLSPELVINTVNEYFDMGIDRNDTEIIRTEIFYH